MNDVRSRLVLDFTPGNRVVVVKTISYKRSNLNGRYGTVVSVCRFDENKLEVKLDDIRNPLSAIGHFYFYPDELSIQAKSILDVMEGDIMQNVVNYFNIAKVQYLDSNKPSGHVYANFDMSLKVGDLCVVKSLHHGLGLARVVEIEDKNNIQISREIVARVDTSDYDMRVEARKNTAELKAKMQERAKKLQDIALYKMLAKEDSEMAELLSRYESLPLY